MRQVVRWWRAGHQHLLVHQLLLLLHHERLVLADCQRGRVLLVLGASQTGARRPRRTRGRGRASADHCAGSAYRRMGRECACIGMVVYRRAWSVARQRVMGRGWMVMGGVLVIGGGHRGCGGRYTILLLVTIMLGHMIHGRVAISLHARRLRLSFAGHPFLECARHFLCARRLVLSVELCLGRLHFGSHGRRRLLLTTAGSEAILSGFGERERSRGFFEGHAERWWRGRRS